MQTKLVAHFHVEILKKRIQSLTLDDRINHMAVEAKPLDGADNRKLGNINHCQ